MSRHKEDCRKSIIEVEESIQNFCEYLEREGPTLASKIRENPILLDFHQFLCAPAGETRKLAIPRKFEQIEALPPECLWTVHPNWRDNLDYIVETRCLLKQLFRSGETQKYNKVWNTFCAFLDSKQATPHL